MENEFAVIRKSEVIQGVHFVQPKAIEDDRGRFLEIYRSEWIPGSREMVQSNRSFSRAGVLRGMHYHLFQADYWYFTAGHVFVALYDHRGTSKTAEKAEMLEIKDGEDLGIYIPPGVAHGFYAIGDTSLIYMVDQYFDGTDELGIYFDDPALEIAWPIDVEPILSLRDRELPMLADIPEENLPL
ncbi:MAG TPA: dTDP-4-dehydrorhamnose 3,5-epimerase [Actinomycetota bacterium]|nr:dTDP-4-dehydrorhamnose 3,5-epimerase [Actinomycetota bacterium]